MPLLLSDCRQFSAYATILALSGALLACGSSSPSDTRGTVNSSTTETLITQASIGGLYSAADPFKALVPTPKCDVSMKRVTYQTVGGLGEATTGSTLLAVPTAGASADCSGTRPVLVYAHAAADLKTKDMSLASDPETRYLLAFFASQGYVVVAPNYAGYTDSSLSYHPFLIAEAQARDVIDALRASKQILATQTRVSLGKLFVNGHSTGGYVAMATVRALERDYRVEWPLAGSVLTSGPYALSTYINGLMVAASTSQDQLATLHLPMLIDAYQAVYKNIYTAPPATLYDTAYVSSAVGLFPSATQTYAAAISAGKIPATLTGSGGLVLASYASDYASNFAATGTANTLLANAITNNLLTFRPQAKMALCYGSNDTVIFPGNSVTSGSTTLARDYFLNTQAVTVEALDLSGSAAFPRDDAPRTAWSANSFGTAAYHAMTAPFCMSAALTKFNSIVAN
jgi:pimeloyl-ACP methyl ester carboxylesterase